MRRLATRLTFAVALAAVQPALCAEDSFRLFTDRIPVREFAVERNLNEGGYLVVASRDARFNFLGNLLEARRIERRGGRTWLGPVTTLSEGTQIYGQPELSFSPSTGTYLLSYIAIIRGKFDGPFGQLLSAEGKLLSEPFRISPPDPCRADDLLGVAYSEPADRWLVAWRSTGKRTGGGGGAALACPRIRARYVRPNGVLGRLEPITGPGNIAVGGDLAYSAERSEFLVVWSEGFEHYSIIFGRVIREQGRDSFRLVLAEAGPDCLLFPRAAGGSAPGQFLVSWENRCAVEPPVRMLENRVLRADESMKRVRRYRVGDSVGCAELAFNEPSGRFVAVWDEGEPETIGDDRRAFYRVFRSGGRPLERARTLGTQAVVTRVSCSAERTECLGVWLRRDFRGRAIGRWIDTAKSGRRP